MDPLPQEALDILDAAAGAADRLAADGYELHFATARFRTRPKVRALLRDRHGRTVGEVGLLDALELISA
jgi:hypothetical protein